MIGWRQQDDRRTCGQTALAALLDISVEDAIGLVGHDHGTRTCELVAVLRQQGFSCPDRCRRMPPPELGLGQARKEKRAGWHWVAVAGDKIYDGVYGYEDGTVIWPAGVRITSYLPVTR
jgi:hypothetical protein